MNCVKYSIFFNKRKFDFESRHPDSEPAYACFRKKRGMDNSERFRACFSDNMNRLLSFAYLPQIHFRIDLDGRLDEIRLLDALQLAVRATPVMLLRSASTDSLILKLNHQAADACAVKEFGYLLAFLYDRLKTRPQFQPQVDCRSRSLRQVFGPFSAGRLLRLAARHMAETLNNFHPSESGQRPGRRFLPDPGPGENPNRHSEVKRHRARIHSGQQAACGAPSLRASKILGSKRDGQADAYRPCAACHDQHGRNR